MTLRLTDADGDVNDYRFDVEYLDPPSTSTPTPTVTPTPTYTATPSPRPPLISADRSDPLEGQVVTLSVGKPANNAHHSNIDRARYQVRADDDAANAAACGDWEGIDDSQDTSASPIAKFYRSTVRYVSGAWPGVSSAINMTWHAAAVTFSPTSLSLREDEGVLLQNDFSPEYLFAHNGRLYGGGGTVWTLSEIDTVTGAVTILGVLNGTNGARESTNGVAVVDGTPYLLSFSGNSRGLYLIAHSVRLQQPKLRISDRFHIAYRS